MQERNVRSILVIDDDPDDFELVKEAILQFDPAISVSYINNCEELVQYRRKNFDLVLLDINMPHHDGFFWLKSIRKNGYNELPVIMYTNSLSPAHIAQAYEEGANLYFSKPDSFSQLVKGLKELLRLDWTHPFSITEKYQQQGRYRTFSF